MKHFDKNGYVICQECGRSFKTITSQHLKKEHDLSYNGYKSKHNNPPMKVESISYTNKRYENITEKDKNLEFLEVSQNESIQSKPLSHFTDLVKRKGFSKVEKSLKNVANDYVAEKENDIPFNIWLDNILFRIQEELYSDNDFDLPEYSVQEETITMEDSYQTLMRTKFDPNDRLPSQKIEILAFLYSRSKHIQNDYLVELFYGSMHLGSYITDIADPKYKEVFFFPDVFWRNEEESPHPDKYKILEDAGWKIYVFRGTNIIDQTKAKFS